MNVDHGGYRGFGGYCFPKDLDGFIGFARQEKLQDVLELLQSDRNFNEKLLKKQGLSLAEVSLHIDEVDALIKNKNRK